MAWKAEKPGRNTNKGQNSKVNSFGLEGEKKNRKTETLKMDT